MAKRKQSKRKPNRKYRPPSPKLLQSIEEGYALIDGHEYGQAYAKLVSLLDRNPRSKLILQPLLEVCEQLKDWHSYVKYGERLAALERGEDQALTLNNLMVTYGDLACPGLMWTTGERIVNNHPDFEHVDRVQATMVATKSFFLDDDGKGHPPFDTAPFEGNDLIHFVARHDRLRLYSECGDYGKALETGKAILSEYPTFAPALNNVASATFMLGNHTQAIETVRRVLQHNPQDVHAKANLVRFLFLSGQFEQSAMSMQTFRSFEVAHDDLRLKQAECYAYLGDDQSVLDIFALAQKEEVADHPFFMHFAAAANMRVGRERIAWRLWQQALDLNPGFTLAEQNLADQHKPIDERDAPFYFSLRYWFSADLPSQLLEVLGGKSTKAPRRSLHDFLKQNPHILPLSSHVLDRGDDPTRQLVIAIYNNSPSESLAETLYQFATGRWGSYQTRMNALRAVSEHHPDLIPDDHTIKMYVGGEQSDVMFLNHHIYWGPKDTEELDDAIIELHTEAYQLIQAGDYDEAEPLLHEIIAAAPDFPSAYNHLAMVYQMQDRQDEAFALIDLVNEKFPDYFFGRIAKANQHTLANETVQASAILKSLFQIEELHISEYRALAQAQVQLAIKEDRRDVARSWLSMWEQVDEGNPLISSLKIRVEGSKGIIQRLRNLLG